MNSRPRSFTSRFLIPILVLNSLGGVSPFQMTARAQQKKIIIVNAEQPNVWTLEQAHYLLAQMHRRNLDLRAKSLDDLDPNEITGLRFDVMRMLLEFGATFNQADLATNRLVSRNREFNSGRREQLLVERDRLRRESLRLTGEIDDLEAQKADADAEDEAKRIDSKLTSRKARRDKVDKEIEFLDGELGTLSAPSSELRATEAQVQFDPDKLPKSAFDDAFKAAAAKQIEAFNNAPKINASLRLENFLQMQYEIIAKQLTLLRDEVGPGERLLFLELPQTVNVTHHEANDKWAQSWWRIAGYTRKNGGRKDADASQSENCADPLKSNCKPESTSQKVEEIMRTFGAGARVTAADPQKKGGGGRQETLEYISLDNSQAPTIQMWRGDKREAVPINDQTVRTVELIPRQSSLNVNDMKLRVRSGAFSFALSTLFGFGSRLNVQRQREQFSQFVQQELYSSAFGKGAREFGWTFTPMPGTDRLMSGVRTTYAVLVVPEEATALVLESNGCYFPRSAYQPNDFADTTDNRWNKDGRTSRNCGASKAFVMPIPVGGNGRNEFWVRSISYQPVKKGERVVVLISGDNFSAQTGVLVSGVPLVQSIGLAQPLIRDDSKAGEEVEKEFEDSKVHGRVERVDSNKIVFSFEMPPDYVGTPTITLIGPGRAIDINWLTVNVNDEGPTTLIKSKWMIGRRPADPEKFRIDGVRVFRGRTRGTLTALVSGAGFLNTATNPATRAIDLVLVNGASPTHVAFESAGLMRVEFPVPVDDTIKLTLVSASADPAKVETVESEEVTNPARLMISDVEIITYEAATKDERATLVVKITGTGFTNRLRTDVGQIAVKSATEAVLKLTDPDVATFVTLVDGDTGRSSQIVVTRKTKRTKE